MYGLWNIPTQMVNQHGVGMAVWTAIVLAALFVPTLGSVSKAWRSPWPGAGTIAAGMVLGVIWYLVHMIDLTLHYNQTRTTYAYAVAGPILYIPRACSDALLTIGILRLTARFLEPGVYRAHYPHSWSLWAERIIVAGLLGAPLVVLTLTRLFLTFSLAVCWLAAANLRTIDGIARACYGLDAGYTALQFVSLLGLVIFVEVSAPVNDDGKEEFGFSQNVIFDDADNIGYLDNLGTGVLPSILVRSFCEVIIAGQMSRTTVDFVVITRARDVLHGLFSIPLFWLLYKSIPTRVGPLVDRWRREAEEELRAELAEVIRDSAKEGKATAMGIMEALDVVEGPLRSGDGDGGSATGGGGATSAAGPSSVPAVSVSVGGEGNVVEGRVKNALKRRYIKNVLRKRYAGWTTEGVPAVGAS